MHIGLQLARHELGSDLTETMHDDVGWNLTAAYNSAVDYTKADNQSSPHCAIMSPGVMSVTILDVKIMQAIGSRVNPRGSKFALSYWKKLSLLTQCWSYGAACDTVAELGKGGGAVIFQNLRIVSTDLPLLYFSMIEFLFFVGRSLQPRYPPA